ncbi:MAG: orotidine-5'-phosphate decarboxylase [Pirellulaceae bacterium]|nr:orotidine-5'-phosphate decarboxylase [Pirellulaceae bacterium]
MPAFSQRLSDAILRTKTPLVVGLDPRLDSLPQTYQSLIQGNIWDRAQAVRDYCCWVVDAVADIVPAVKPQLAFFEELGPAGTQALADVVKYAREKGLLVIGDGKRGDIGTTATAYANAYLGVDSPWGMDCLTVNPYLGADTLQPFVRTARERQAGIFVLVKTSNPGSGDFQDLLLSSSANNSPETLYQRVATELNRLSNEGDAATDRYGLCEIGAVVGATYPQQLVDLRQRMPKCWLLIPGFGAQGGTAEDTAGGFHPNGLGAIVNSSRAILYAFDPQDRSHRWIDAVRHAALTANQQLRDATPAGNL